ncbi:ABC transporter permease [Nocardiopsis nanhaiensis]
MSLVRLVAAETYKAATLPAVWVGLAVAVLGAPAITLLNAINVRNAVDSGRLELIAHTSPVEAAFAAVPLGTVGAVVLGVVVVSSEYTANRDDAGGGRQITATLTAAPGRLRVLWAKALVTVLLVTVSTAVTLPASLALARTVIGNAGTETNTPGDVVGRALGALLFWTLTALIAMALTVLTRSGIIPIIVLVTNSSLVSFSMLLSNVTSAARYLPDLAGTALFLGDDPDSFAAFDLVLGPLAGGLVMAAWAVGLLAVAVLVLQRRDA